MNSAGREVRKGFEKGRYGRQADDEVCLNPLFDPCFACLAPFSYICEPDGLYIFEIGLYLVRPGDNITVSREQVVNREPGQGPNALFQSLAVTSGQIRSPEALRKNNVSRKEGLSFGPVERD